jgi:Tol biopolymer transport system component
LVVVVTPDPKPGSDEISHAAGDSWIGLDGYKRADRGRQLARAFIGTTRDQQGRAVDELFIVDIPDDISIPGPLGPLEGTETSFPMPPAGAAQRRLTHTENAQYPGCQGIARSSPDGARISFRMRDRNGQWQIFLIAPHGGEPQQATLVDGGVDTDARWHPSGHAIACVARNRILVTEVRPGRRFGQSTVINDRPPAPFALVWSHDGKTLAYNRIIKTDGKDVMQIFVADYTASDE